MIEKEKNKRHIRQGKETDFNKIRQIISSALSQCVTNCDEHYQASYLDVCGHLDWWKKNKDKALLLVCEQGDSILGMAYVREFWNFDALFVEPRHYRRGIGRDLVEKVISICKDRSPKGFLRLNSPNYAADFYRKMGFLQIAEAIDRPGGCVPFKLDFKPDS